MFGLSIGLSSLAVNQRLMELAGQNIANAQTPGYHRQVGLLAGRIVGLSTGVGVELTQVLQARSGLLETAIRANTTETSHAAARMDVLRQIETLLTPGPGSVLDLTAKFFNQLEELGGRPADLALRRGVLNTAVSLAARLNGITQDLARVHEGIRNEAELITREINTLAQQAAELNGRIAAGMLMGQSVNDLSDRREQVLSRLSGYMDLRVVEQEHGQVIVLGAGVPLVSATQSVPVQVRLDQQGRLVLTAGANTEALTVTGGKLAALFQLANVDLTSLRERLDVFTREFVRRVDGVQATGLDLVGAASFLGGQRGVADADAPLAQAGLALPPTAGPLFLSVTDLATGQRTLHEVAIDPATQTLHDVALAISTAAPHVQAVVNSQTGTLTLLAQPGYAFDFAGRLPSMPPSSTLSGTAGASLAGAYTGTANDVYTFRIVGSGTVGLTPGLRLEVRNGLNQLLASLNIGQGYEAGTLLHAGHGVSATLSAGTVHDGEGFSTPVVADPDAAGLLPALGLNPFFESLAPGQVRVRRDLLERPELLSASRTGEVGDNGNVRRFIQLRNGSFLNGGRDTFEEFYMGLVTDVGLSVQDMSQRRAALESVGQSLEAERLSVSGVDPNEELLRLLSFQRAYQMSARYIAAVNETLDSLLGLV